MAKNHLHIIQCPLCDGDGCCVCDYSGRVDELAAGWLCPLVCKEDDTDG